MSWQAVIDEASALVASINPVDLADDALLEALVAFQAHVQVTQSRVLALLTACESRNLPSSMGAAHPIPWAAHQLKISSPSVRLLHGLAGVLAEAPVIGSAFEAGRIGAEQARLMASTAVVLPSGSEAVILARGEDLGPDELRGVLRGLEEELDPFGAQ